MKKPTLKIIITGLFLIGVFGSYPMIKVAKNMLLSAKCSSETADDVNCFDYWKILDPKKIDEKSFYRAEDLMLRGNSGSGGSFLDDQQIQWTIAAVKSLATKGIQLKDSNDRAAAIADSYVHLGRYDKAYRLYQLMGWKLEAEECEWYVKNGAQDKGERTLIITEHPGTIQTKNTSSKGAQASNSRYEYISFFKGAIFRYDKLKNQHAVIYGPEAPYDWADDLKIGGDRLIFKLRSDVGGKQAPTYVFDSRDNSLVKQRVASKID